MSGTIAQPIGITNPPIDELLSIADSKYALVIYSAKRARQINAYYSQLQEGLLDYVGPLVDTAPGGRPRAEPTALALADSEQTGSNLYRDILLERIEINEGMLTSTPIAEGADVTPAPVAPSIPSFDDIDLDEPAAVTLED